MDDAARRSVYIRMTWRKIRSSKATWAAFAILAAITAVFWARESLGSAVRTALILGPYFYLFLTQDMMRSEIDGGALENVLFCDGGFRAYLKLKNAVTAAAAAALVLGLIAATAVPAALTGAVPLRTIVPLLALSLSVGVYYALLGNTLSLFLKGGSNVMIVLVVQAALFVALILTVKAEGGVLSYLETGTFPGWGERLKFMAFAAVCPSFLISERFLPYALEFLSLAALLWVIQSRKIRGLELERR